MGFAGVHRLWAQNFGLAGSLDFGHCNSPGGSIHTTIVELGPKTIVRTGFWNLIPQW